MKMPENTGAYVRGAAIGAIVLAILGFTWGGWVTGGTATREASAAAHDAVVVALAPICAERFREQADASGKIATLVSSSSWERGSLVEKSGFAAMPGSTAIDGDVARACAEILTKPATPKS